MPTMTRVHGSLKNAHDESLTNSHINDIMHITEFIFIFH